MTENNCIRLRAVEPEDVDVMFESDNDADSIIWTDYAAPLSRNQLMEYALTYDADPFNAGQLRLMVENGAGDTIGIVDLYDISARDSRAFVGIYILPGFRRKGFGLSSMEALKSYCRSLLGLNRLAAKISSQNPEALALFSKAGFMKIALLPSWHKLGPSFHDINLLLLSLD